GPVSVPLQFARRRPAPDQLRGRQHLMQDSGNRPGKRPARRGNVGERLGRRHRHAHQSRLRQPVRGEAAPAQKPLPRLGARRRNGGFV
nr:hypothetical protein [Tanacetum cinerariifolium]